MLSIELVITACSKIFRNETFFPLFQVGFDVTAPRALSPEYSQISLCEAMHTQSARFRQPRPSFESPNSESECGFFLWQLRNIGSRRLV